MANSTGSETNHQTWGKHSTSICHYLQDTEPEETWQGDELGGRFRLPDSRLHVEGTYVVGFLARGKYSVDGSAGPG